MTSDQAQQHAEVCKKRGCTWFVENIKTGRVTYHRKRGTRNFPAGIVWRATTGAGGGVSYHSDNH